MRMVLFRSRRAWMTPPRPRRLLDRALGRAPDASRLMERAPNVRPFLAAAMGGAALAFFLDPVMGRRRRHVTGDRARALFRRFFRGAGRAGRIAGSTAYGYSQRAAHLRPSGRDDYDDVTLAHRVESEIFRDHDVEKGRINVNAEEGVVVLRGEVERADQIRSLESAARRV